MSKLAMTQRIGELRFFKTKKEAIEIVGGELRANKKMPCKTFNLSPGTVRPADFWQTFRERYVMIVMPGTDTI